MSNRSRAIALSLILVSLSAQAMDLAPPFALDTAETLPANVRNPRFINIFASLTSKFGDDGVAEGLGAPLLKAVTPKNMYMEQEDSAKRTLLQALIKANGMKDSDVIGSTTGEVNTFANIKVAALAWGITDRFTMAVALPIIHIDVNASTGFTTGADSANYNKLEAALAGSSSPRLAQEATTQFNDAVNRKLLRLGYDPIPSNETISGIGDMQLIGKYRVYNDGVNGVSLKGTLIFPTGIAADPNKALDIPTSDGRLGAGLALIYDRKLPFGLRWDNYASYTAMLPHSATMRIPTSVDDPLSADSENIHEYTRNQAAFGTGMDYLIRPAGVILGAGYSYQFLTRADYAAGSTYSPDRYYLLGDQKPLEDVHSFVASAAFSTIDWYMHHKFVAPFQVGLSYSHPIAGRNVASGDLYTFEVVGFF